MKMATKENFDGTWQKLGLRNKGYILFSKTNAGLNHKLLFSILA